MPDGSTQIPVGPCTARLLGTRQEGWEAPILDAWRELSAIASDPNPSFAPSVLVPALRHMTGGRDVRCAVVERDGVLIGLAPLARARKFGPVPFDHAATWLHAHSYLGTPLAAPGHEAEVLTALGVAACRTWRVRGLCLTRVHTDGPVARAMPQARRLRPYERACLDVPADADAYLEATIRGKKRKEYRRQWRRLAEQGDLRIEVVRDAAEAGPWTAAFLALEAAGWKGEGGTSLSDDPAAAAWFAEAMPAAAADGLLTGLSLTLDGRQIAALVILRGGDGAFTFKTAYDESLAEYSPGVQIQLRGIERYAELGFRWADSCARKDHPMINALWTGRVQMTDLMIPAANLGGRAGAHLLGLADRLHRRYLK